MEPNPLLFRDLTYIFIAAVIGGLVAWRLRLPLIIGFVLGGIVISPFTPGPHVSSLHTFEVFAEVGVVLLMF
jgi:CPA2 family monovalent cation:H+ antiporter-2